MSIGPRPASSPQNKLSDSGVLFDPGLNQYFLTNTTFTCREFRTLLMWPRKKHASPFLGNLPRGPSAINGRVIFREVTTMRQCCRCHSLDVCMCLCVLQMMHHSNHAIQMDAPVWLCIQESAPDVETQGRASGAEESAQCTVLELLEALNWQHGSPNTFRCRAF